jgi:ligand-binding SRPBCC domain-containing protein
MMPEHILHRTLTLDLPRKTVFDFFADAANLGRITPPEMDFAILTPLPIEMNEGALLDYRMKLHGFAFNWTTRISAWSPPDYFIDEQLAGPYRQWIHRHTFSDGPDGSTIVEDEVRFRLPLAPLGEAAYPMVSKQLERIFLYRQEAITSIFLQGSDTIQDPIGTPNLIQA